MCSTSSKTPDSGLQERDFGCTQTAWVMITHELTMTDLSIAALRPEEKGQGWDPSEDQNSGMRQKTILDINWICF